MSAAGHVIEEERLVGRSRVQAAHVLDGLVRQVGGEVVAGLADPREYRGVVLEQIRRPLVGLAAHVAVEILEAHARRPLVERAGHALLKARRVVVLAKPRRGKTVIPEYRADGGVLRPDDGIVAREAA